MDRKHYLYKVLKEKQLPDGKIELVSLFDNENGSWSMHYTPIRGNIIRARTDTGIFCFSTQSPAVAFMRRNNGLYRLWLMLAYGESTTKIEVCPPDGAVGRFADFWKVFRWGNTPANHIRNKRCVPSWQLARAPRGSAVTRALEVIKLLYFQPVPDTALYEPMQADLDRIGWLDPLANERRW